MNFGFSTGALDAAEIETIYWREMLQGAIDTPADKRNKQHKEALRTYYIAHHASDAARRLSAELASLRSEEDSVRAAVLSAPVMQELDSPRPTRVLMRGQYDQPGEQVSPGVPAALGELAANIPRNRLGLANWLVAPANPLTARVAVNRYWQLAFGDGLVRTANDFGLQGEMPTHPQLLDWLAVRLPAIELGRQGTHEAVGHQRDLPPVVSSDARLAAARSRKPLAGSRAALPIVG